MPVLEDVKHWVRAKFSKDPYIDGTPAEKIREAHSALKGLSQNERAHRIEHVTAYTKYFYGEDAAPKEIQSQLLALQTRADNLKSVDAAREVLDRYGGPPTQATITEALQRSEVERQRIRESAQQIEAPKERNQESAERFKERQFMHP